MEHRQVEGAPRQSEARFRQLVEHATDIFLLVDADGHIIDVNQAACETLGYSREDLLQMGIWDVSQKGTREEVRRTFEGIAPRMPLTFEDIYRRKDGLTFPGEARVWAFEEGGRTLRIALVRDISERHRADQALRESEERYRDLFEAAPIAYNTVGADGRIKMTNAQTSKMLGYTREELKGRHVVELYADTPSGKGRAREVFRRFLAGEELLTEELEQRAADGRSVWVRLTVRPVRDEQGQIVESRSAFVDITEQKHMEEALKKARNELELRVAELETFSYSVSHDLRAPLRAIDGFSRIFRDEYGDKLDAEAHRLLDVICRSAETMGQLISDLLVLSRIGRREMSLGTIDMGRLATEVFEELRPVGTRTVRFQLGPLPEAGGDRAMIRQVWVNLLSNAIKFTAPRDPAVIEIGHRMDETGKVYWVKDNGVGFDAQYASRAFGVFQRLHTQEEFEGTGVGLAIVQQIVQRHGGRVWAEGEIGRGATIYFTLPR